MSCLKTTCQMIGMIQNSCFLERKLAMTHQLKGAGYGWLPLDYYRPSQTDRGGHGKEYNHFQGQSANEAGSRSSNAIPFVQSPLRKTDITIQLSWTSRAEPQSHFVRSINWGKLKKLNTEHDLPDNQ